MKSKPVTLCLEETDCYAGGRGQQELSGREGSSSELPNSAFPSSVEVLPPLPSTPSSLDPYFLCPCGRHSSKLVSWAPIFLPFPNHPALCFQTAGTGLDSGPPPGAGSPSGGPQETPGSGLQTRSWGSRDHAGLNPCSWRGWCPQLAGHPTDCFQIAQGQHRARGDPEQPRAHCSPAAKKVRGDEGRGRGRIFSPGGDRWPPQEGSPGRPLPAR